jgi:hypothetical protein
MSQRYEGQIDGREKYAEPMQPIPSSVKGMASLHNDIGEKSGFQIDGYIDKKGTPYGEAAKFNFLPPGMDITNQENSVCNDMALRQLVSESYPGDGWMPAPRDVEE